MSKRFYLVIILLLSGHFLFAQRVKLNVPSIMTATGSYIGPSRVTILDDYSGYNLQKQKRRAIRISTRTCNIARDKKDLSCLFWSEISNIDDECCRDVEELFFKSIEDFYDRIIISADSKEKDFFSIYHYDIFDYNSGVINILSEQYAHHRCDVMVFGNKMLSHILQLKPDAVFRYLDKKGECFYCVVGNDVQIVKYDCNIDSVKHWSVIKDTLKKDILSLTFDNIPKELLENFDKMGVDNYPLLNSYEAAYLNLILKDIRGDFDFEGKKIHFFLNGGKKLFFEGEKNRYAEGAPPSSSQQGSIYLKFHNDGPYKEYDAIIDLEWLIWKLYDTNSYKK